MPAQIFNRIYNIIFFWRPKRKRISVIPAAVLRQRKSIHHAEKNAAVKVITYCKKHYIPEELIEVLYDAELKYETEKYRIQHEFPHLKEVLKEEIRKARDEKYALLKDELPEADYQKYRSHRRTHKEKR
jgi:hypothetical protein